MMKNVNGRWNPALQIKKFINNVNWCWCRRLESKSKILNVDGEKELPLPSHLLQVIFSKLPLSNLPVCRLVCKSWNDLFLEYASSSSRSNAFLLSSSEIVPNPPTSQFQWCNPRLHCIDIDTMTSVASFGFDHHWSFVSIINSCNGLLFISKGHMYEEICCDGILNPMTNEFIQIPLPEVEEDIHSFGFGFSPITKQYKLFRVSPLIPSQSNPESDYIMEVFRFGGSGSNHNQWRHLHRLSFSTSNHGAYLNGVIYWIGKEKHIENQYILYALDVHTEKIEPIRILKVDPHASPRYAFIKPFYDNIYVTISMTMTSCKIQVWIIRVKDSWIREFVIDDIPSCWLNASLDLVKVYEDGVVLFKVLGDIFSSDKTWKKIKIKTMDRNERLFNWGACHIESLNFGSLLDILAGHNFGSLPSILAD